MKCSFCTRPAVTECHDCRKPICENHTRRGDPRDLKYNGGFFKKDYCDPCYDAAHQESFACACVAAAIMIPVAIILILMTMAHP